MFMSNYRHALDDKNRMRVPSKFKDELGEEFVITRGNEACLFVMPKYAFDKLIERITAASWTDASAENAKRNMLFYAQTINSECRDAQGRFVLNPSLRQYASISKKIVFAGAGDRIELWSEDKFDAKYGCVTPDEFQEDFKALKPYGI